MNLRSLFAASSKSAGETPAEDTQPVPFREAITRLLELEGCQPRAEGDSAIVFRYRELGFFVQFNASDPEYVRLVLPYISKIDTDAERVAAYEAANVSNATCKAAKVTIERDKAHAATECFLATPHHLVPVLLRSARALEYAARAFDVAHSMIMRR